MWKRERRGVTEFKLDNSFADNIALFKAEVKQTDPECARILFDNLHLLDVDERLGRAGSHMEFIEPSWRGWMRSECDCG